LPNFAYLIYKDYFGCQNRETTHTLVKIATQGDSEAMNKVLTEGFLSGDCIAFAPGDIVFITDHGGFLSGTVKIRRQGETESYWTITEATMGK
jgi:predicted metal-dependent enzyme (double-stranded beta helix superfamily)